MAATSETEAVLAILRLLNDQQIAHLIVGSLSVNYYGQPRSTNDVDLVIDASPSELESFLTACAGDFETDSQYLFETITGTTRLVLTHRSTRFKVELFLLSDDPFALLRFSRRIPIEYYGVHTFIPSKEDVVIQKLRWLARGKRAKDRDDARMVLAVTGNQLDMEYIRSWTERHGSTRLLDDLLSEIGTPPNSAPNSR